MNAREFNVVVRTVRIFCRDLRDWVMSPVYLAPLWHFTFSLQSHMSVSTLQ